jgi:hypothetical protein
MKKILLKLLALLSLLTLSAGCGANSAAKAIKALGTDNASFVVRLNGWGTVLDVTRANPKPGSWATVAKDGTLTIGWNTNAPPPTVP